MAFSIILIPTFRKVLTLNGRIIYAVFTIQRQDQVGHERGELGEHCHGMVERAAQFRETAVACCQQSGDDDRDWLEFSINYAAAHTDVPVALE